MEAFSLLKYWRGGGAAPAAATGAAGTGLLSSSSSHTSTPSTLTTPPLTQNATDSSSDEDEDNDDGPFFDLEFTVPDEEEVDESQDPKPNHSSSSSNTSDEEEEEENDNIEESEGEGEFKFTLSPSANDHTDLSPSDDLFFKGKLVQVDPSSFEPNSKPPQFTASLFKSATKFRVFMSGLKKSKSNTDSLPPNPKHPESETHIPESQKKQQQQQEKKLFTVKFKVEEVPIMSLFTRDNSSKANNSNNNKSQSQKQNHEDSPSSSSSKEVMHKYLKMVKPLYIRVSRRYGDKLGFSGHLNLASEGKAAPPLATAEKKNSPVKADSGGGGGESAGTNSKGQKQGNLPAGLRVVCKHLGKSRSASSTVAAPPPPPPPSSSKRRDDSLLQQQDGIQGAILHCKRSFNASRECQASQLPRSVSDPLHEISSRKSTNTNEGKDDKHL